MIVTVSWHMLECFYMSMKEEVEFYTGVCISNLTMILCSNILAYGYLYLD